MLAETAGDRPHLRWSATPAASTRAINGYPREDRQAGEHRRSSRWTCRPISSVAATSTPSRRAAVSWTDHLLWHHAGALTVDLFAYQAGEPIVRSPTRSRARSTPELGIAMDMSHPAEGGERARSARCRCRSTITGRSARSSSAISATPGPISRATTIWSTAMKKPIDVSKVDVSMNGIELQDREFISAIREGREPISSVQQVLPAMRTLDRLERELNGEA